MEQITFRMFKNQNLSDATRHQAAISIFKLPSYYKVKTKMSPELLEEMISLNP